MIEARATSWVRSVVVACALGGAALPARAAPPRCGASLEVPVVVQRGPTCAVAAVVMAARGLGLAIELRELAREVPVWADGVSFFDLEEALAARGVRSLTFPGDPELAARFIAAGVPVVAAVRLHGGKHAIALASYQADRDGARCGPPARFAAIDPWAGQRLVLARGELERMQAGRQLFVLWPREAGWEARLSAAGIDLAPLAAEDRRFRAEELVIRARRHPAPNAQMLRLLERAVSEDPSWEQARALRDEVARALGR